jgi:ParB-like chromosome segregation protein Spo0J
MPSKRADTSGPVRNRIVRNELVPIEDLLNHPDNWRIHPEHQRSIIRGSFSDLGIVKSIQVVERDGKKLIVDGHARVFVLRSEGAGAVPCDVLDLDDGEVRKALASLDPISDLADVDFAALSRNLAQIGPTDDDLAKLFEDLEAKAQEAQKLDEAMTGRTETNFHSVQKAFKDRKVAIKLVLSIDDVDMVETALAATGNKNRAEAMKAVCSHYLGSKGLNDDRDQTGQLDRASEDSLEAEAARYLADALSGGA